MTTRVHNLAKELGVTSKAILEKCRAEGLGELVKNHMAMLSAGLEATIREWFSEGAAKTAVETAEAVDMTKARRRPRKKKVAEGEAVPVEATTAIAEPAEPVVTEPVPAAPPEEVPAPVAAEPVAAPEAAVAAEPPSVPAPAEPATEVPAEVAAEPSVAAVAPPAPEEPAAPAVAKVERPKVTVGPKNVPAPARMKGPTVVRVERPEVDVRRPRPRGPAGGEGDRPAAGGTAVGEPPRGPKRRGGVAAAAPPAEAETEEAKAKAKRRGRSPRRSGRSETVERIREWRDQDLLERQERLAHATGRLKTRRSDEARHGQVVSTRPTQVVVETPITVKALSAAMSVKSSDIIRKLMDLGVMAGANQSLEADTVASLAAEFGVELDIRAPKPPDEQLREQFAAMKREHLSTRPPVVTFLGHVDHGKTSLLDRIRDANVVSGEAGGITQHIGAYRYDQAGRQVVFLDTPGHEAFTHMRSRGANMTDVVVLVVAADDGVMPQTVEAINHAKAAGVPIVVALNKIDRPDADEHRVLGQLAEQGLSPREWGGTTEVIRTSALTGRGIDDLLELLSLEAELLELKADLTLPASGTIIEARMDPGRGVLAKALVQDGTLRVGDVVVSGPAFGRVKALLTDRGVSLDEAPTGTPIVVSGLSEVPEPGDRFYAVNDLGRAKDLAEASQLQRREDAQVRRQAVTLENLFTRISAGEVRELPLILKADVQGSVDVLTDQIGRLGSEEVKVRILHAAVGGVNESDVLLAAASQAIIIGFHVVPDEAARALAAERGVQIRLYKVIYEITDAIRQALEGMLKPEIQEKVLGHAEVRETFKISRVGTIAGCHVTDGIIPRSARMRLSRDGVVIQDGLALDSLKRFKDDVREVRAGLECGLKLSGFDDVKVGDRLEAWTTQEVARTLD